MNTTSGLRTSLSLGALLIAAACGGGGGGGDSGGNPASPTVTAMSTSAAKYSGSMLVTLNGSNLDSGLTVASAGCKAMTRSSILPNVSDASTAYYNCVVSGVGAQTVAATRASDGAALKSTDFTVAMPQVTMTIANGTSTSPSTFTGTILLTLAPDKTPVTVDNFLRYVQDGFYNNTVFHRYVPGFVLQGGGYRTDAARGLFDPIPLEVNKGLSNTQWSVAMARVGGNASSATSQFFVNLVDNTAQLDPHTPTSTRDDGFGYAVFGTLAAGSDVITAITKAPCAPLTISSGVLTQAPECTPQPFMTVTSATQTR